jgi:hypothetical protein
MLKTVMTRREEPGPSKDVKATTSGEEPNVQVKTLPWYAMILIRAGRVYLQSFLGFLTAGGLGVAEAAGVPLGQFGNVAVTALQLAVAPATISLLWNTMEILTKLDTSHPQMRA